VTSEEIEVDPDPDPVLDPPVLIEPNPVTPEPDELRPGREDDDGRAPGGPAGPGA
jgi:hypothetical protein